MKITIISIGSFENSQYQKIFYDFAKRLKWSISLKEILPKNSTNFSKPQIKENEANLILKAIKPGSKLIALDEKGKQFSSQNFTKIISDFALNGNSDLTFIIGGAEGLSPKIIDNCHLVISLSPLTFPHLMVRIILIEQIYRAYSIINNHPYHRE
jgi:23S rRNA (pseudouridine1915-N3)-methyltransferase